MFDGRKKPVIYSIHQCDIWRLFPYLWDAKTYTYWPYRCVGQPTICYGVDASSICIMHNSANVCLSVCVWGLCYERYTFARCIKLTIYADVIHRNIRQCIHAFDADAGCARLKPMTDCWYKLADIVGRQMQTGRQKSFTYHRNISRFLSKIDADKIYFRTCFTRSKSADIIWLPQRDWPKALLSTWNITDTDKLIKILASST